MLKFYKRYNLLLIIPILTFLMVSSIYSQNQFETNQTNFKINSQSRASYSPHGTVYIANDDMLNSAAIRGSGTITDPYILEGWNITADGLSHGIFVQSTTKYFVIQDCWIECSPPGSLTGINIVGTANGTVAIRNNYVSGFDYGISVHTSQYAIVENNICENNDERAIEFYASNDGLLINNTCKNNGLEFTGVGIFLRQSSGIVVTQNRLINNSQKGVYLYAPISECVIYNNIFINNSGGVGSQGFDDGYNNQWYNSDNSIGNYWDDWGGIGTYSIDGSAGAVDSYPLAEPIIFEFQYSLLPVISIGLIVTALIFSRKKKGY